MSYDNPPIRDTLSPAAAAEKMKISIRWLRTLRKKGKIPSLRYGNKIRYSPEEVDKWIRTNSSQ